MLIDEFPGPTPQLIVTDIMAAIDFYRAAFDAEELFRKHTATGLLTHCELLAFNGRLIVTNEIVDDMAQPPEVLGACTARMHLYVSDVAVTVRQAIAAGGEDVTVSAGQSCTDGSAVIRDPAGHLWTLAAPPDEFMEPPWDR